ncbi:MAG: hypothetical protein QOG15_3673 [Solirubrobacteraceae bacterium]|jgi:hypothetical protein|nr:hypothetical protein [Solirubrobacteraceae bacterium]
MSKDVDRGRPLRIAMIAPPWIPVPPPAYGGLSRAGDRARQAPVPS